MVILYFSYAIRFAGNVIRRIARVAAVKLHKNRLRVREVECMYFLLYTK